MSTQNLEILSELNRQRVQEEMAAIHREKKATKGKTLSSRFMVGLGNWMVERGKKLQAQNAAIQSNNINIGKDAMKKVGA